MDHALDYERIHIESTNDLVLTEEGLSACIILTHWLEDVVVILNVQFLNAC